MREEWSASKVAVGANACASSSCAKRHACTHDLSRFACAQHARSRGSDSQHNAPPCQLRRVMAPQAQATCNAVSSALLRVHFPGALVRGFRRLRSVLTLFLAALRVVLEAVAVAACGGDGANMSLGCLVG